MKVCILPDGSRQAAEVTPSHVVDLEIDCGCWGHRRNFRFQLVTTNAGSSYVRGGDEDEGAHRTSDRHGPIMVRVVSSKHGE